MAESDCIQRVKHHFEVRAVCVGQGFIATASMSKGRLLTPMKDGSYRITTVLKGHESTVNSLCTFGGSIASASNDRFIRLWDVQSHLNVQEVEMDLNSRGGPLRIKTLRPWKSLRGHASSITCVQSLPSATLLASASKDNTIKLWDPNVNVDEDPNVNVDEEQRDHRSDYSTATLDGDDGHTGAVTCCVLKQDRCFSGARDKKIIMWDLHTHSPIWSYHCKDAVNCLDVSESSVVVAGVGDRGKLLVKDTRTPDHDVIKGKSHSLGIMALKWVAGYNAVVTGGSDSVVKCWQLRNNKAEFFDMKLSVGEEVNCVDLTQRKEVLVGDMNSLIISKPLLP